MGSLARRPLPSRASQRGGEHVREVQEQSQALELLDTPLVGERFLASGPLEPDLRCRPLHDTRLRTPAADRITWSRSLNLRTCLARCWYQAIASAPSVSEAIMRGNFRTPALSSAAGSWSCSKPISPPSHVAWLNSHEPAAELRAGVRKFPR